ncbi:hypothetical protein LY76DRAFT_131783 [Colletotrichum caudatum]|nr:hypothetical protein LY76DRAFT_131783 [Colletotrichum caudatum]
MGSQVPFSMIVLAACLPTYLLVCRAAGESQRLARYPPFLAPGACTDQDASKEENRPEEKEKKEKAKYMLAILADGGRSPYAWGES